MLGALFLTAQPEHKGPWWSEAKVSAFAERQALWRDVTLRTQELTILDPLFVFVIVGFV